MEQIKGSEASYNKEPCSTLTQYFPSPLNKTTDGIKVHGILSHRPHNLNEVLD